MRSTPWIAANPVFTSEAPGAGSPSSTHRAPTHRPGAARLPPRMTVPSTEHPRCPDAHVLPRRRHALGFALPYLLARFAGFVGPSASSEEPDKPTRHTFLAGNKAVYI